MRLKVGKTYKNREGETVRIVAEHGGGSYPFDGDDNCSYKAYGAFRGLMPVPRDLVEEVVVPPVPAALCAGPTRDEIAARIFVSVVSRLDVPKPELIATQAFTAADAFIAEAKAQKNK
jgi:hypothetical protein